MSLNKIHENLNNGQRCFNQVNHQLHWCRQHRDTNTTSETTRMIALYICCVDQRFECTTMGPCGPNAVLLRADDRAALCFSLRHRGDTKWASVCAAAGHKVTPDKWKGLCTTQRHAGLTRTAPKHSFSRTHTHTLYPTVTISYNIRVSPAF